MSYIVNFTETTNPSKDPILVQDQTLEQESTDLTFIGKNYAGYSKPLAENFLHLLENFANSSSPSKPVQGQLWYDTLTGQVNVYDSLNWIPVGGIKKSPSTPSTATNGDLWIDTTNNQLNLFSGANWVLVGPNYSSTTKSGPIVETIVDTTDANQSVISFYINDQRVAIVSFTSFTPKSTILGLITVNQGINLVNTAKFWGIASEASALNVNGVTVDSRYFLRSDIISTTDYAFNIRNNNGLSLGSDLNFSIYNPTDSSSTVFYTRTPGHSIDIRVNSDGSGVPAGAFTSIHVGANGKVGIGANNTSPSAALDVSIQNILSDDNTTPAIGIKTDGRVRITNTTDSTGLSSTDNASLWVDGGISVQRKAYIGDKLNVNGSITVGSAPNSVPLHESVIIPGPQSLADSVVHKKYDIGSINRSFKGVYADKFYGTLEGNVTGTIIGNIQGSASSLRNSQSFSIIGDIYSTAAINFNGTAPVQFNTSVTQDVIVKRTEVTDSFSEDVLLIYRPTRPDPTNPNLTTQDGLKKIKKSNFVKSLPTIPVGAIFPFAGAVIPTGYVLCDGAELLVNDYPSLFSVIGYSYKARSQLLGIGTFGLPDLRGRFPLGRDNMVNTPVEDFKVPEKDPVTGNATGYRISTVSTTANIVADNAAKTLGSKGPTDLLEDGVPMGTETRKLKIKNLPQHRHDMQDGNNTQFYAIRPDTSSPSPDTGSISKAYHVAFQEAQFIPHSGDIQTASAVNQPINIMNPFLAINYIIYTGK